MKHSKNITAFTLIELLVVISIIALLVAILLPALARARGAAMTVKSTNQIRQLTLATFMYTDDFKSFLPYTRYNTPTVTNTGIYWCNRIYNGGYISDPLIYWGPFRDTSFLSTSFVGSNTYLYFLTQNPTSSGTTSPHFYAGYGLNQHLSNTRYNSAGEQNSTYRIGDTVPVNPTYAEPNPSPSEVAFFAEVAPYPTDTGRGSCLTGSTSSPIYTPEGNATRSYLDGHAASRDALDLNWIAETPVSGQWKSVWTTNNVRYKPWFRLN